ncbi:DUF3826 domain-containing protein [uncultured Chitinophaga sp.]|uniref:DUF3826 domain-containing protein n=1 Tax=uncultured Chitinophaga sp. TaxID=339340 RepID=UPI002600250C|nr:DUF3826 domain-containing protein [uncultured Chitinophaga sp.]
MKKVSHGKTGFSTAARLPRRRAAVVTRALSSFFLISILIGCFSVIFPVRSWGQEAADYKKVVATRSEKIVSTLGINDSAQAKKVLNEIIHQYINLNTVHEENKQVIAGIKAGTGTGEEKARSVKQQEEKKAAALAKLHQSFIIHLKQNLNEQQLEQVKNGMTYSVLPVTYTAYQDMLPGLTAPQKEQIYAWLIEARELAMDEGSSDDKHKMFGKYKGRINNYLSAAGYDLKKETAAWQQRTKEKQQAK